MLPPPTITTTTATLTAATLRICDCNTLHKQIKWGVKLSVKAPAADSGTAGSETRHDLDLPLAGDNIVQVVTKAQELVRGLLNGSSSNSGAAVLRVSLVRSLSQTGHDDFVVHTEDQATLAVWKHAAWLLEHVARKPGAAGALRVHCTVFATPQPDVTAAFTALALPAIDRCRGCARAAGAEQLLVS